MIEIRQLHRFNQNDTKMVLSEENLDLFEEEKSDEIFQATPSGKKIGSRAFSPFVLNFELQNPQEIKIKIISLNYRLRK